MYSEESLQEVRHKKVNTKYEYSHKQTNMFGVGALSSSYVMDTVRHGDNYCCCCVYNCGGAVNKTNKM
ncbi:hypothetical protein B7H16_12210 [Anoxybacillus ayderensis]|nr:hypothetical protein B7H16_12210 [Anoxybacillus ayderensis]